jgi:hypothetical protein
MTSILKKLGDNWHVSCPYEKLILSVLPTTKYVREIEDCLISVYVEEHYDFKKYKTPVKYSIYDTELDRCKDTIQELQDDMKKEEETLNKLTKKFEELECSLGRGPSDNDEEEDEEEEDSGDDSIALSKGGKQDAKMSIQVVGKNAKQALREAKEEKLRKEKQVKATKSNMAVCQEKLVSMQKEIEMLEKKISYYNYYREADLGYQATIKKLIQTYEKDNDVSKLIQGLDDMLTYYHMIRRRYIPTANQGCSGLTGLCESHLLPLKAVKYSERGEILSSRCSLHPC